MQADLSSNEPLLDIEIMGVNWVGLESANPQATDGKSIPWLQDVDSDGDGMSDAWGDWGAEHLDLVVLDAHNEQLTKTNLIAAGLQEQENYSAVRDALVDAAMESQKPWHNPNNPLDIDGNSIVIPLDVLLIVNRLDSIGAGRLPPPGVQQSPRVYYDSNGDGDSTPLDVLLVVNFLNDQSEPGAGEGESLEAVHRQETVDIHQKEGRGGSRDVFEGGRRTVYRKPEKTGGTAVQYFSAASRGVIFAAQ